MRKRAKNLSDADIKEIAGILDGWTGRLSWEALLNEVALRLGCHYTRQTLHKHERIRAAFTHYKEEANGELVDQERKPRGSIELQKALERISRLEAQLHRLEMENSRLLEQFVRWAYNAHTRNLDENYLNRPLPPVDRDRTRFKT